MDPLLTIPPAPFTVPWGATQIMPHPVYAPQSWVCVLNPSDATFQAVRQLLAEAYDLAVRRFTGARPVEES